MKLFKHILLSLSLASISSCAFAQDALYSNEFPLQDVKLLDSRFKDAMNLNVETLLSYDTDRLLAPYFKEAGLQPKGENFKIWE